MRLHHKTGWRSVALVGTVLALLVIPAWMTASAQQLSSEVFPSEDELLEALLANEIGYAHYVILRELAQNGLDSSNAFLLDEIPNLVFFRVDSLRIAENLEDDQTVLFQRTNDTLSRRFGTLTHSYYQKLDDENATRYRLSSGINLSDRWTASFKVHREYNGEERFVSRRVRYRNGHGSVRELEIGDFVTRLGLGTVIGYRGNLLGSSGKLDGESLLCPDNGGFNGVHARIRIAGVDIQTLGSYRRDSAHTLSTVGGMVAYDRGSIRPSLILAANRLTNRIEGTNMSIHNCGLFLNLRYSGGYNSCEFSGQTGATPFTASVVSEGRHRFDLAEIRYALWSYGDRFVDLNSGSKAAVMSRRTELEEVSFEYSNRRAGQDGLLAKSTVQLSEDWKFSNAVVIAVRNSDTANIELMSSINRQWTPALSTRIEYLTRERRRGSDMTPHTRRARLEARFKSGNLNVRTYIAYASDGVEEDCIGLFGSASLLTPMFGRLEIWSNLGRVRNGKIEYCYMYFRNEQVLMDDLRFVLKIANSYSRNRSDSHLPVLSLELSAAL